MSDKIMKLTINGKKCAKCSMFKPRAGFFKHSNRADGLQVYCKRCTYKERKVDNRYNTASKKWYHKKGYLKKAADHYGISVNDYNALIEASGNRCQLCLRENTPLRRLSIDHDHVTGQVRGVLCINCNSALGLLQDSTDILELAIKYLKGHNDGQK